jgi:ribosome-associated protein
MTTSRRSPRPRRLKSDSGPVPARRTPKPKFKSKSKPKPKPKPVSKSAAADGAPTLPAKVPRGTALIGLEKLVLKALEDLKAVNIKVLDVRGLTDVADTMIVASGTSDRHVRAIAENVIAQSKAAGRRPMGTEGATDGEWVLVDLQDVLVHIMLPRVREFYALEQLWEAPQAQRRRSRAPR